MTDRPRRLLAFALLAVFTSCHEPEPSNGVARLDASSFGLVAAYGFDESNGTTTADASGNGFSGTLSNASWTTGKYGAALRFTGKARSWVTVGDAAALRPTTAFTISAWVNPRALRGEPTVIFKERPGTLMYALYGAAPGSGPSAYVTASGSYRSVESAAAIPLDTWTHLAATLSDGTLTLFVNGQPVGSAAAATIDSGAGSLRIGGNSIWNNEGWNGSLDEVRIYDRALSAAEIQSDMATPVNAPPGGEDTTPPVGTVAIDGGAIATHQTAVTLSLSASDASGVALMRFSNDGVTFAPAVPYSTTAAWSLAPGDGPKTVRAQFQDGAGNWSPSSSATITLDTQPPAVSAVAATSIAASAATIVWTTSEAASSSVDFGATSSYGQSTPVDPALVTAHSVALGALTPATTYHYRVRSSDAAGNQTLGPDAAFTTAAADATAPSLGAHVLLTQDEQLGTNPATTAPIVTRTSGSSLLALTMGWASNFAAPTDSYHNGWTALGGKNLYAGGDFYTAMWAVPSAAGGSGHTLSVAKNGHPSGELSMAFVEVVNGGVVKDWKYRYAPDSDQTPGSVTTTGPATLIAVWGGDAWGLDHDAIPDSGFTIVDKYLELGPTSGVQVAVAVKEVASAGTYSVKWQSSPLQGCACYLIAVQHTP